MKTKKSTRKFIKNRLKTILDSRKKHKANVKKFKKGVRSNEPEETVQDRFENSSTDSSVSEDEESMQLSDADSDDVETSHKDQLDHLKTSDPEFYQFLQENDQELLAFDDSELEEEEEDLKEDETEELDQEEEEDNRVTDEMIQSWKASMEKNYSLKGLRKMLSGLRAAAAIGDENDQAPLTYIVEEGEIFNNVVLTSMEMVPSVLNHHLSASEQKASKQLPSASAKWKKVQPLVKSFLASVLRLLKQLTDPAMLSEIIRGSQSVVLYFACFPKLGKEFTKQLLHFWSMGDEQVRIVSFLCLRQMAVDAPHPYLDRIFKGAYKSFTQVARNTSIHTITHLSFMSSCLVELAGLQLMTTYQHGFVAIRELALLLRSAVNQQTKESFKAVYSWSFLHRLKLWGQVIATYGHESAGGENLMHLIYPLVQIALGVIRLKPSSKHFPMRFQVIRLLLELSAKTKKFIPLASYIFEIFDSAEISSRAKPSTLKPLDLTLSIRAPNGYLSTKVYQDSLIEESVNLFYDIYASQALSISFPELSVPGIIQMKRWIKKSKNFSMNKQVQQLIEKLEQNRKFIESARSQVEFSPKDLDLVDGLDPKKSPLIKFNLSRQKIQTRVAPAVTSVPEDDLSEDDHEASMEGDQDQIEDFVMSD